MEPIPEGNGAKYGEHGGKVGRTNIAMHIPVLLQEVLDQLNPQPNEHVIDCTAGGGGHTLAIAERVAPKGKVLAIDWDPSAITALEKRIAKIPQGKQRIVLANDSYTALSDIVTAKKFGPVHGILLDLGFSSFHLDESERGFAFRKSEQLDMRYNPKNPMTASKLLNYQSRGEIEWIFKKYGEERFSRRIAEEIVSTRRTHPIETTSQLVEIIERSTPASYQRQRLHAATRVFQALRIAVNNELENLESVLPQARDILEPGGRLVVISFHSLEDRIVKHFLRNDSALIPQTKKPIMAKATEVEQNPRSRSAKLRSAIKSNQ
ncbi:MAG: 16S rRNA (cytosine(1402)-N(4))-methyltransferase RsmH [bacterium]|nr:16S rRNA (cytosine(1402)-N(4))-methyltransferase RsmH [bacterium]